LDYDVRSLGTRQVSVDHLQEGEHETSTTLSVLSCDCHFDRCEPGLFDRRIATTTTTSGHTHFAKWAANSSASRCPTNHHSAHPTLTSLNRALIGTWVGESSDGQSTAITFEDSGQFSITVGTDVEKGTYTADFSFRPGHLDIEGTWTQGSKVTTIIEFVDDNHIRIGDIQPGQTRPATFSNSAITLSRQ
jgi:hypothetical protein